MAKLFSEMPLLKKVWVVVWQFVLLWLGMVVINLLTFAPSNALMSFTSDSIFLAILAQLAVLGLFVLNLVLFALFASWYSQITVTGRRFLISTSVVMTILIVGEVVLKSTTAGILDSLGIATGGTLMESITFFVYQMLGLIVFLKTGLEVYKEM